MIHHTVALLLDSAPINWTSQEDRHLKLVEELATKGVKAVLVFSAPLKEEFEQRFRRSGAAIESINYGNGPLHYYRELSKFITKHSITLAHIVFFDYFSVIPWIARISGIRHIIYEMQNSGILKAQSWKKSLLQIRTSITTNPVSRVIAISEFVKDQLIKGGLSEDRIIVRYLGIDTDRFCPDPRARDRWRNDYKLDRKELLMSTVSYLRPFKNPQTLVEACGVLKDRDVPVRLFVAGDGEMRTELEKLSLKLAVNNRIHWLGNLEEPRDLLQASDVFLLASVGEAFGLVLAEAMACGVPVVGTRSGSLPEVVEDGQTGILTTPLDSVALADAIQHLALNHDVRNEMARKSRERVCEKFTVEKSVEETIKIYETVWGIEKS